MKGKSQKCAYWTKGGSHWRACVSDGGNERENKKAIPHFADLVFLSNGSLLLSELDKSQQKSQNTVGGGDRGAGGRKMV